MPLFVEFHTALTFLRKQSIEEAYTYCNMFISHEIYNENERSRAVEMRERRNALIYQNPF